MDELFMFPLRASHSVLSFVNAGCEQATQESICLHWNAYCACCCAPAGSVSLPDEIKGNGSWEEAECFAAWCHDAVICATEKQYEWWIQIHLASSIQPRERMKWQTGAANPSTRHKLANEIDEFNVIGMCSMFNVQCSCACSLPTNRKTN